MPRLTLEQIQKRAEELSELRQSFRQFHSANPHLSMKKLVQAYEDESGIPVNYHTAYSWITGKRKGFKERLEVAEEPDIRTIRHQLERIIYFLQGIPMLSLYAARAQNILRLKQEGKSLRDIGQIFHISHERVRKILEQIEKLEAEETSWHFP